MTKNLSNVCIVSPDVEVANVTIRIGNGRISGVTHPESAVPAADEEIDCGGRLAMPGFWDIHAHGAAGDDVCDDSPGAIARIAERKLREGVTTWLPTTLSLPPERLLDAARNCAESMANPKFCRIPGLHLEGPFLHPGHAGAQNPEFIRPPDFDELRRIHETAPVRILSLAPELDGASDLITRATAAGITCSAAHTSATAAGIREAKRRGLRHLTHFCNAMTPLHHREIGAVGAGLVDDSLMLEIIGDTIHLGPEMLKLIFRLVPIDRLMLVTDSTAASWLGEGEIQLGGLAVVVANGRAVLKQGGALAGSALRYHEGVANVAELTGLPLHQIVKATSWNQARSLGIDGFGKLEPGFHADIVILNEDFSVWKTFVGGVER